MLAGARANARRFSVVYGLEGASNPPGKDRMIVNADSAVEVIGNKGFWLLGLDSNQQPSG
jgi:hypothetical protein